MITDIAVERVEFRCPESHWRSVVDYDVVTYTEADEADLSSIPRTVCRSCPRTPSAGRRCARYATVRWWERQSLGALSPFHPETTVGHGSACSMGKHIARSGATCRCCLAHQHGPGPSVIRLGRKRKPQRRRNQVLFEDGVGADVLDRVALIDHHLDQLVDDVGHLPNRAFTQRASLAVQR